MNTENQQKILSSDQLSKCQKNVQESDHVNKSKNDVSECCKNILSENQKLQKFQKGELEATEFPEQETEDGQMCEEATEFPEEEMENGDMCEDCFQFFYHNRCTGCQDNIRSRYRHACCNYDDNNCPNCDTELFSII